ncbi:MAG: DNA polymerase III subunit epsilon [Sphingobacteriales bacterium]|nr:MAG: DNA polymerase III subunit epsilon [Sphingobacteriales bacterium]
MLYAIVDIETTGSHASAAGITDIAIVIHDGQQVLDTYQTLVNPQHPIPRFIQGLTGITDQMVAHAPVFEEIAETVARFLRGKIFVAHNVNFDYSFVKACLEHAGHKFEARKLCTIRYARKVVPGLRRYGLASICPELGIEHNDRHRALGDAEATARLFALLVARDTTGELQTLLKGRNSEQYLPPHVPVEQLDVLPPSPGVYYFYNASGKPVYVGKAINLKKRVRSHFSNNKTNRQKADFLREIHRISYTPVATDLMAHILESVEIRRLWPSHNRSQRGYHPRFGLFCYEDRNGYKRLMVEKHRMVAPALYSFNTLNEGYRQLRSLAEEFTLCPRLCALAPDADCAGGLPADGCNDACKEAPAFYNARVDAAMEALQHRLPTFALFDTGRQAGEQSCILVQKGNLCAMGYMAGTEITYSCEQLLEVLDPIPDNDYIRSLVYRYAGDFPEKVIHFA